MKNPRLLSTGITGFACLLGCAVLAQPAAAQPKAEIRTPAAIDLSAARKAGTALRAELLSMKPAENTRTKGSLRVSANRQNRQVPFTFSVTIGGTNWTTTYEAWPREKDAKPIRLTIRQGLQTPNDYTLSEGDGSERHPLANETMVPFAGSDFWLADLGLEFLHWPDQRVTGTEMRRGQSCRVLESINPKPAPGAYRRVVSWIDIDSGGIVHADAYDSRNAILKQFDPKEFKKVEGQWQLAEMEIRNRQTGSRTLIEFDLANNPPPERK